MKPFVLIGHVYSGKSTIGGHLLSLCGAIEPHEIERIEKKACEDKMEVGASFRYF